jgi:hypothetical protein
MTIEKKEFIRIMACMFVPSPIYILGSQAFQRYLGHEGGALMMELVPLSRRQERACFLSL